MANGTTCIFDYALSLYDVNDLGDYLSVQAALFGEGEAEAELGEGLSLEQFINQVMEGLITLPRDEAEQAARLACMGSGGNQVIVQVQVGAGVSGSIGIVYNCNRWTDVD